MKSATVLCSCSKDLGAPASPVGLNGHARRTGIPFDWGRTRSGCLCEQSICAMRTIRRA